MDGYNDDIMIALLPMTSEWCSLELPHVTLIYGGKVADRPSTDFNEMAKSAMSLAMLTSPLTLFSMGVEQMGEPDKVVSVIRLRIDSKLMAMRNFLVEYDTSEYPEFKPHATIGPYPMDKVVEPPPRALAFDRIGVFYGKECLTFWLNNRY